MFTNKCLVLWQSRLNFLVDFIIRKTFVLQLKFSCDILCLDDKGLPLNDETDEDLKNEVENKCEEEDNFRVINQKSPNKELLSELHRGSPR